MTVKLRWSYQGCDCGKKVLDTFYKKLIAFYKILEMTVKLRWSYYDTIVVMKFSIHFIKS
jgi:hypothetical protein